ncbi:MAG: hypothetical protein CMG26_02300 [Candidatus Marinimicrobia bacterium]|nr:hypothetical protein [Candidatus Neomarinimicrobiota bacterium]MBV67168.1 hypothetical protein [Candidatus Neomarinimicrobiota bacterium]|tara:strand:- start:3431 stop:4555 length:1125 start_codon:yes stop_codon:yes gene_type:complete
MLKYLTIFSYILIALFLTNCASGPSSVEFTSAKTKARSERNLKDAENYALQALSLEAHAQDAQVPYFLATEIYKPQKNWTKVVEMFDEAMKRDPEAMLLQPLMYNNEPIYKMQDQINIYYKNELWFILFNKAVKIYEDDLTDPEIINLLELAMYVDPNNVKAYILLATTYNINDNLNAAKELINNALRLESLQVEEKARLCSILAEFYKQENNYSDGIDSYMQAYDFYKSIDDTDGVMSSMVGILGLNLLLEDWLKSIQWAEKIYEDFYLVSEENEIDILFNISLAYNNAASSYYNVAGEVFNSDNPTRAALQESMNNYNIAFEYFDIARDFFMELEDMGSENGASMAIQVKDYMDLIEDTQIPFVQKQLDSIN